MTAGTYEGWAEGPQRDRALGRLPFWIAASIVTHIAVILFLLLQPDPPPLTIAEREVRDRPPVEMVTLPPPPPIERMPAPEARADRPTLLDPPRLRQPRPDGPIPLSDLEPIDPRAIERFLAREALRARENEGGLGNSWTACSLLSPERRAMEPACDGMLLQYSGDPARGALLTAPDAEMTELIRKLGLEEQRRARAQAVGEDASRDRSYRDQSDDYYGPKPWE